MPVLAGRLDTRLNNLVPQFIPMLRCTLTISTDKTPLEDMLVNLIFQILQENFL